MGFLNRLFSVVVKGITQEQSLAPSSINFLCSKQPEIFAEQPLEQKLLDMYLKRKGEFPKIQVVKKDGYWFALNSAQLQLYRILEFQGQCAEVKLEVVSLRDVPKEFVQMMIPPDSYDEAKAKSRELNRDTSQSKGSESEPAIAVDYQLGNNPSDSIQLKVMSSKTPKGYHKLEPTQVTCDEQSDADDVDDVTEDDVSDGSDCGSSIFELTESELEWSEALDTDGASESDYEDTSDDDVDDDAGDEKECLL